jgi:hypothetical protein
MPMRFRLRTLLIVLALAPPAIAFAWPPLSRAVHSWLHPETEQEKMTRLLNAIIQDAGGVTVIAAETTEIDRNDL